MPETSSAPAGLLTLLRNRTFLLLESRATAAGVGYTVYLATILWLSLRLTGGIFLAGVLVGMETAVYTATFLVGPIVDRVRDKRWVFVACYPVQAVAAFLLGLTYVLGVLTVPVLVGIVVLLAALWDFTWAADSTSTRLLFGKDRIFAISGLGSAVGGAVNIALYLTAGATIALFGAAGGSYLYAGLLLVGAGLACFLPIPTPGATRVPYFAGLREGWDLFRGEAGRALRHLAAFQAVLGFFIPIPLLLLTLNVERFLAGSQSEFAGLYVAYLVGGIVVGVVLGRLNPRRFVGSVALVAIVLTGGILGAALLVAGAYLLALGAWFAIGVLATARSTALWNYVQGAFPPEILARAAGNTYLFVGISSTAGAFVVGALSLVWTPAELTALAVAGFALSAGVGYLLSGTRTLAY